MLLFFNGHQGAEIVTGAASSRPKSGGRGLWGLQALLMLIGFLILFILFREAIQEVERLGGDNSAELHSALLKVVRGVQLALPRLNRALAPDYTMKTTGLSDSACVWALVCVLGNVLNALILFASSLLQTDRHKFGLLTGVISILSIALSLVTVPFVFASMANSSGSTVPIDLSIISAVIYCTYLISDVLATYDSKSRDDRNKVLLLIMAVDLPCLLTTASLSTFGFMKDSSAEFSTGASSGLLIYSSLAFLFVSMWSWLESQDRGAMMKTLRWPVLIAIAVGAALNATIGFGIVLLKLPIYLDTLGSITIAMIYGPLPGVISALLGSIANGLLTTPITIAYAGTAVGVTAAASYLTRWGFGKRLLPSVIFGTIILGPLSSLLSIPITTYLFSGVTFTGSDVVTAFFLASGHGLLTSIASGALPFDAIDKGLTSFLCYIILRNAPKTLLQWNAPP